MIGTTKTATRRTTVVAAVTAVVATIAAPAVASVRPDDRAGVRAPGASPAGAAHRPVRPDDRAGVRGMVTNTRVLHALRPLVPTSDSFDWNAGLIGAGVASGAAACVVLGAIAIGRRERIVPAAHVPTERSLS